MLTVWESEVWVGGGNIISEDDNEREITEYLKDRYVRKKGNLIWPEKSINSLLNLKREL